MTASAPRSALRWRARWLAGAWFALALVVVLSLVPSLGRAPFAGIDKLEHALAYGLLMAWFGALQPRARHAWIALALLALGALVEAAQGATGYREADLRDLGADALGIAAGALLAQHMERMLVRVERALGADGDRAAR